MKKLLAKIKSLFVKSKIKFEPAQCYLCGRTINFDKGEICFIYFPDLHVYCDKCIKIKVKKRKEEVEERVKEAEEKQEEKTESPAKEEK